MLTGHNPSSTREVMIGGFEMGFMWIILIIAIVAEIVLAILASIIVFWFSRKREYRADSGAARLVGKRPMMDALDSLNSLLNKAHLPEEMAAFGISGRKRGGLAALSATHPDLDDRIRALEESQYPDYIS
jgi:heat shock protein HtpX